MKKQSKKILTYEPVEKLAQQYYNEGGDSFVECWDKKDYEEYTKEFGGFTVRKAIDTFHTWDSVYRDRACDW